MVTCVGRPRPDSANGVELTAFRLSEALVAAGHEVFVASITKRDSPIPIPGVQVALFTPSQLPFGRLTTLERAVDDWSPDVVLITSVYSPAITRLSWFLRRRKFPYVVSPNGGLGRNNELVHRWKKVPYKLLFELPMLNHSTYVWSIGDQEDIKAYGTTAPILSTTKGLDFPHTTPVDRHSIEGLHGLETSLIFGFVGRLDPVHKGLDIAIAGFAQALIPNAAMVFVGPATPKVERSLRSLAQASFSEVRFLEPMFSVERDAFLGAIDVFFHTSRWEGGIPYAVIEAAAMARPLLLTRQADPAGMLESNGACLIVELESHSVADAMRRFAEMGPEQRTAMGARASATVRREFGWDKMARGLVDGLIGTAADQ